MADAYPNPPRPRNRSAAAAFGRLACGLLSLWILVLGLGCRGYRLGPTNPELTDGRSIQVLFFENCTIEPGLPEALNQALRQELQRDGSYRLRTDGDSDVLVRGAITGYERRPLAFQPTDVITATDYELRLTAQLTAVERLSGRLLVERALTGRTSIRLGNDLPSAERQALPLLAEDWARQAAAALTEGSW
jgi:hypothetical protein